MKKLLTTMAIAAFSALASLAIAQQRPNAEAETSAIAQQNPEAEAPILRSGSKRVCSQ